MRSANGGAAYGGAAYGGAAYGGAAYGGILGGESQLIAGTPHGGAAHGGAAYHLLSTAANLLIMCMLLQVTRCQCVGLSIVRSGMRQGWLSFKRMH